MTGTPTSARDASARKAPRHEKPSNINADAAAARLLTADDLARRWSVPKAHVYRLSRERGLPTVRLGRYYRYRLAAIEEWEAAQEAGCNAR